MSIELLQTTTQGTASAANGYRVNRFGISKLGSLLVTALLLGACASSGVDYSPADGPGAEGYSERAISSDRYSVTFVGDNSTELATVQDYALLRAAELTVQKDYDYFSVASRETIELGDSGRDSVQVTQTTHTATSCGLLGCRTTTSPGFASTEMRSVGESQYFSTTLEVVMREEEGDDNYNAREIIETIRGRI